MIGRPRGTTKDTSSLTASPRFSDTAIQIEWPDAPPILIAYVSPGVYWISTRWFDNRHERLILVEDLEDFWPPEVLELVDTFSLTGCG